jgi:Peptidase_C39 like family
LASTYASVRDAAQEVVKQGHILPHQLAALTALDQALTPEQRQSFTDDWRAKGSPAAPVPTPPAKASNPLANFPYFSQISADGSDGPLGWRQCQTSALSMCLAYLKTPGINDDSDYLKIVQRFGDTTDQAAHQKALAELGVKARFVQNCSAAQLQAEIRAGLPAAIGILHHGPVAAPSGGGHWIAVCGFTPFQFIVNDPYGELDLVSGTWLRTGGNSGKGLRYSYRNLNPRWLPDGPASGWAWLFS